MENICDSNFTLLKTHFPDVVFFLKTTDSFMFPEFAFHEVLFVFLMGRASSERCKLCFMTAVFGFKCNSVFGKTQTVLTCRHLLIVSSSENKQNKVTQWLSQLHVTMAGPNDRAGFILAPV